MATQYARKTRSRSGLRQLFKEQLPMNHAESTCCTSGTECCPAEEVTSPVSCSNEPRVQLQLLDESNGIEPRRVWINKNKKTKITIGRAESCDVVIKLKGIPNPSGDQICVSRLHCEIEKNPLGQWALFDKGSRNGCFVNGVKVSSAVLEDGDIIVLGGGIVVESGAVVSNLHSMFKYRFSIQQSRTPSPRGAVKRKLSDEPDFRDVDQLSDDEFSSSMDSEGSARKRVAIEKENCVESTNPQLHDELSCGICLDVQIHPRVLGCGHSFCARCITTALGYHNRCPSCKTVVVSSPKKVVSLENAIASLYHNNPEYRTRKHEAEKLRQHEKITSDKLIAVIDQARLAGQRFLNVGKRWDAEEKKTFKQIALYKGPARVEYCRVVGLTYKFINQATAKELVMAALNVGINSVKDCSLKDRLRMFIKYG